MVPKWIRMNLPCVGKGRTVSTVAPSVLASPLGSVTRSSIPLWFEIKHILLLPSFPSSLMCSFFPSPLFHVASKPPTPSSQHSDKVIFFQDSDQTVSFSHLQKSFSRFLNKHDPPTAYMLLCDQPSCTCSLTSRTRLLAPCAAAAWTLLVQPLDRTRPLPPWRVRSRLLLCPSSSCRSQGS